MKGHKIKGVDRNVCTCEQKIAYNFAFMWYDTGRRILNSEGTDEEKEEEISTRIYKNVKNSLEDMRKKYDVELIMEVFKHGFKNYCLNFFIANDYESIGNCFSLEQEVSCL